MYYSYIYLMTYIQSIVVYRRRVTLDIGFNFGSGNRLSPYRCQAITCTDADLLWIAT